MDSVNALNNGKDCNVKFLYHLKIVTDYIIVQITVSVLTEELMQHVSVL
mgnify:CR=1 FL=1